MGFIQLQFFFVFLTMEQKCMYVAGLAPVLALALNVFTILYHNKFTR